MIQRVYNQCIQCSELSEVLVATDDERIIQQCQSLSIPAMMTSSSHINGTERCAEVVKSLKENYDLIINIQGDEPFIHPESIGELIGLFQRIPQAQIGTLKKRVTCYEDIFNPSIIKVISNIEHKTIYFSRGAMPYQRDILPENYLDHFDYYKHIGMYAYRPDTLSKIVKLKESSLEKSEKLEQLRWLENGFDIYIQPTNFESKSIDTREDYEYILSHLSDYE